MCSAGILPAKERAGTLRLRSGQAARQTAAGTAALLFSAHDDIQQLARNEYLLDGLFAGNGGFDFFVGEGALLD
jgi:hypothetical protein